MSAGCVLPPSSRAWVQPPLGKVVAVDRTPVRRVRIRQKSYLAPAGGSQYPALFSLSFFYSMTQTLVSDIDLIGNQTAAYLYDAGYVTLEDVREATAEELIDVEGVGVGKLGKLIALDRDAEAAV